MVDTEGFYYDPRLPLGLGQVVWAWGAHGWSVGMAMGGGEWWGLGLTSKPLAKVGHLVACWQGVVLGWGPLPKGWCGWAPRHGHCHMLPPQPQSPSPCLPPMALYGEPSKGGPPPPPPPPRGGVMGVQVNVLVHEGARVQGNWQYGWTEGCTKGHVHVCTDGARYGCTSVLPRA